MKTQKSSQRRGSLSLLKPWRSRPRAAKLKTQKHQKGFTLIEILVVVVVFGIGAVGAFSFFSININNQFEAKNEIIAAGLAQEGVDLVRNIRDHNLTNGDSWDANLSNCISSIDYNSLKDHTCIINSDTDVCLDADLRYCQCGGSCTTETDFTREISVGDLDAGSRKVTCTVTWRGRTTSATDYLYDNTF